jgi:hypothetical protein
MGETMAKQLRRQFSHAKPNAIRCHALHDGKREAKQQRAMLITVASKTPKQGFREKDQQKRKDAVYTRSI